MSVARVILVTGAASGIGRASALRLAEPGTAFVLHTGSNADGLASVKAAIEAKGAEAVTWVSRLDNECAAALAGLAAKSFGGLDVVIAAAGKATRGGVLDTAEAQIEQALAVSVDAFVTLVKQAAPLLQASPAGRVIAVSSFVAHLYRADLGLFAASAASRAALEALVKTLSRDLAASGVTVNAVAPGLTQKDEGKAFAISPEARARLEAAIPLGRMGRADEMAAAIAFLASPEASYITGQTLHVNGGLL